MTDLRLRTHVSRITFIDLC